MNKYLASVIENVKKKHANEPEFVQTVEEVLSSLEPVVENHPEYEKFDILNRIVEPERMLRVNIIQISVTAVNSTAQSGLIKAVFVSNPTYIRASLNSSVSNRFSRTP